MKITPKRIIIALVVLILICIHLGRMDYAEELIKTAARVGADIVKFQT